MGWLLDCKDLRMENGLREGRAKESSGKRRERKERGPKDPLTLIDVIMKCDGEIIIIYIWCPEMTDYLKNPVS
jgi:hypothetical protein